MVRGYPEISLALPLPLPYPTSWTSIHPKEIEHSLQAITRSQSTAIAATADMEIFDVTIKNRNSPRPQHCLCFGL